MNGLVQFLRACLDEDEQAARAAAEPEQWAKTNRTPQPNWSVQYWTDPDRAAVVAEGSSACPVVVTTQGMDEADTEVRADHIARHDPARVLREVEAKRQIIAEHDVYARKLADRMDCQSLDFPCKTLRLLALPYADHPDYQPEWRP